VKVRLTRNMATWRSSWSQILKKWLLPPYPSRACCHVCDHEVLGDRFRSHGFD
jgi:hypothetical protein